MQSNRYLPILLAVTLLIIDQCALRLAQDHFWPETPIIMVMALFTSQLALLTAAAVFYRGLFVLRVAAAICLALAWCRWGSSLVGGMQEWTAMASMTVLPLATVLLVARGLTARNQRGVYAKSDLSRSAVGIGELFTVVAVVAMVFASIRAGIDTPLNLPTLSLALVSALYSMSLVITMLASRLKAAYVLSLVPLGIVAGIGLHTAGGWSLDATLLWAGLHGLLLTGSLGVLRAGGLRVGMPEYPRRTPARSNMAPTQNTVPQT